MADEPEVEDIAPTPAPLPDQLSPGKFDVADWLADVSYAGKTVEVFKQGQRLAELAELLEFIEKQEAVEEMMRRQLTKPVQIGAITDEQPSEQTQTLVQASATAEAIIEDLKGTGMLVVLQGLAPAERELVEKAVITTLKPAPAKFEEIDGEKVLLSEAHKGGREHPEFGKRIEHALIAKSIEKVGRENRWDESDWTPERVETDLQGKLLGPEYRRIANAAYEVNYVNYEIDQKVTLDFS